MFAEQITRHNLDAAYHGSKLATKLKVMGVELASMGITEAKEERDEVVQFTEAKRGIYKKLIVRDGRLVGGILMGDISKAAFLMQSFEKDSPAAGRAARIAVRPGYAVAEDHARRDAGGHADLQLQRRHQGGHRRVRRGAASAAARR